MAPPKQQKHWADVGAMGEPLDRQTPAHHRRGGLPNVGVRDRSFGLVFLVSEDSAPVSALAWGRVRRVVRLVGAASAPTLADGDGHLFVAENRNDLLHVLQRSTLDLLASVPVGDALRSPVLNSRRREIYVPDTGSTTITVLDSSTWVSKATIDVGGLH